MERSQNNDPVADSFSDNSNLNIAEFQACYYPQQPISTIQTLETQQNVSDVYTGQKCSGSDPQPLFAYEDYPLQSDGAMSPTASHLQNNNLLSQPACEIPWHTLPSWQFLQFGYQNSQPPLLLSWSGHATAENDGQPETFDLGARSFYNQPEENVDPRLLRESNADLRNNHGMQSNNSSWQPAAISQDITEGWGTHQSRPDWSDVDTSQNTHWHSNLESGVPSYLVQAPQLPGEPRSTREGPSLSHRGPALDSKVGPEILQLEVPHTKDIPGYLPHKKPLPAGLTWLEVCQDFPNHLWDNILLEFSAAGLTEEWIWNHIRADARHKQQKGRPWNYLQARMGRAKQKRDLKKVGPPNPNKGRKRKRREDDDAGAEQTRDEHSASAENAPQQAADQRPAKKPRTRRRAALEQGESSAAALHRGYLATEDSSNPLEHQRIGDFSAQEETEAPSQTQEGYGGFVVAREAAFRDVSQIGHGFHSPPELTVESVIQEVIDEIGSQDALLLQIAELDPVSRTWPLQDRRIAAEQKWTSRFRNWETHLATRYGIEIQLIPCNERNHVAVLFLACYKYRHPPSAFEHQEPHLTQIEVKIYCWTYVLNEIRKWRTVWEDWQKSLILQLQPRPQKFMPVSGMPPNMLELEVPLSNDEVRKMMSQLTEDGLPRCSRAGVAGRPDFHNLNSAATEKLLREIDGGAAYAQVKDDSELDTAPNSGLTEILENGLFEDFGGVHGVDPCLGAISPQLHDPLEKGKGKERASTEPLPRVVLPPDPPIDSLELESLLTNPTSLSTKNCATEGRPDEISQDGKPNGLFFPKMPPPGALRDVSRQTNGLLEILERYPNSLVRVEIGRMFLSRQGVEKYQETLKKMVDILFMHENCNDVVGMDAPTKRKNVSTWLTQNLDATIEVQECGEDFVREGKGPLRAAAPSDASRPSSVKASVRHDRNRITLMKSQWNRLMEKNSIPIITEMHSDEAVRHWECTSHGIGEKIHTEERSALNKARMQQARNESKESKAISVQMNDAKPSGRV